MYQALTNMRNTYYDLEKVEKYVNVRMIAGNKFKNYYYEAIKDIPAGGELIRLYGFTTWTLELFEILTNKNIVGFAHFINDLLETTAGDPYEYRIELLHKCLSQYGIKDIFKVDRDKYDKMMKSESILYIGEKIMKLYNQQLINGP